MTNWRELYLAAFRETDPQYLEPLIQETETALFLRMQELTKSSEGYGELAEMEEALKTLLMLKIERLGWPDPRQ